MPYDVTNPIKQSRKQKEFLRNHCIRLRSQRSSDRNKNDSAQILNTLKNITLSLNAQRIHSFVGHKDEPDTLSFLKWVLQCGKEASVPCIEPGNLELSHSLLNLLNDLQQGPYGILEVPLIKRIDIQPQNLDLVLIPGIAFDLNGNRLGYGKGYYDRFLKRTSALRIGVCFSSQILASVPIEKHDIQMDGLVSEKGWKKIRNVQ